MSIQTRTTVLSIMVEDTEGTLKAPTATTDFVAVQPDFDMTQTFETLENAELKASLGMSKAITGLESPSFSSTTYLRHSGTEGAKPDFSNILKALFGTETIESSELDTVAGSTTTVVNVDTGEGATLGEGQALLIKNSAGYEIRPISSITGDALTLPFALNNAPSAGVNLGKSITYSPANSGHPTLSTWLYIANGGLIKAMAGSRVTNATFNYPAGELITMSYSFEGLSSYWNPLIVGSSDAYLDFTDDDGTYAITVTQRAYKTPHELADAIAIAMNASGTTETHTVTYSDTTGKFTFTNTTGSALSLLWNTGTNTANTIGDLIGFTITADDTGATTYTSDSAISLAAPYTPAYDTNTDPLVAKDNQCLIGSSSDNSCFAASNVSITIDTPKSDILSVCSASGRSGSLITSRTITVELSALVSQYDADKFEKMRNNEDVSFMYVAGTKTGGNWDAGKCVCTWIRNASITDVQTADEDGNVRVNLTLQAYVNSDGDGEIYMSFV